MRPARRPVGTAPPSLSRRLGVTESDGIWLADGNFRRQGNARGDLQLTGLPAQGLTTVALLDRSMRPILARVAVSRRLDLRIRAIVQYRACQP